MLSSPFTTHISPNTTPHHITINTTTTPDPPKTTQTTTTTDPMTTRPPRGAPRGARGDSTRGHSSTRGRDDHSGTHAQSERPKRENILDLGRYVDKSICVKFAGGREGELFLPGFLWREHAWLTFAWCRSDGHIEGTRWAHEPGVGFVHGDSEGSGEWGDEDARAGVAGCAGDAVDECGAQGGHGGDWESLRDCGRGR